MVGNVMEGEMKGSGVEEEVMGVVDMGEVVYIVVVEVEEGGEVLVGLKKFNQTTKYSSRVYQEMLQKRILHYFLGQ